MKLVPHLVYGALLIATALPPTLGLVVFLLGHIDIQPLVIRLRQPPAAIVLDGRTAYVIAGGWEKRIEMIDQSRRMQSGRTPTAPLGVTDAKIAFYAKEKFTQPKTRRMFGLWWEDSSWATGPITTFHRFSVIGISVLASIPLMLLVAWRAYSLWRRRRRMTSNQCANCGYNLTGLIKPRCPECGAPFDRGRAKLYRHGSWLTRWTVASGLAISSSLIVVALASFGRVIVFNTGHPELAFREYNLRRWGGVEVSFAGGLLELRERPPIPGQWLDSVVGMERTLIDNDGLKDHPLPGLVMYDLHGPKFRWWPRGEIFERRSLPVLPGRRTALVIRIPLWIPFLLFAAPAVFLWRRDRTASRRCAREPVEPKDEAQ